MRYVRLFDTSKISRFTQVPADQQVSNSYLQLKFYRTVGISLKILIFLADRNSTGWLHLMSVSMNNDHCPGKGFFVHFVHVFRTIT